MTNASMRMARGGRGQRCWKTRFRGWRRDSSSWKTQNPRVPPSCCMTLTTVTSPSAYPNRLPCTSQSHPSSLASFLRFRQRPRRQVFPLVGTGKTSQRSTQTLNLQARVDLLRHPFGNLYPPLFQLLRPSPPCHLFNPHSTIFFLMRSNSASSYTHTLSANRLY